MLRVAQHHNLSETDCAALPVDGGDYRIDWTFHGRVLTDFEGQLPTALPRGIVVDAGCSYGLTSQDLCVLYPEHRVVGLDIEEDRLPSESQIPEGLRSRLFFRRGDLFRLHEAFEPSSVACVFLMNNLTHLVADGSHSFAEPLIMNLLANRLERIVVDGGFVCISGAGRHVDGFVWAIFKNMGGGFHPVAHSARFTTSSGLRTLGTAFNLEFSETQT